MSLNKVFALVTLALLIPAFGNGPNEKVYKTPEACFEAMIQAKENEDMVALLTTFTADEQNIQVGNLAYHVEREIFFQTPKSEAAQQLLNKNGLEDADIMGSMQISDSPGGKGAGFALKLAGEAIKDKPQFMKEAIELLNPKAEKPDAKKKAEKAKGESKATLSEVTIEDDRAVGKMQTPGVKDAYAIFFKKENGSWGITSEMFVKKAK